MANLPIPHVVLAGVDFSPLSNAVARSATTFATLTGAERLYLVHVSPRIELNGEPLKLSGVTLQEAERLEKAEATEAKAKLARIELPPTDAKVTREARLGGVTRQLLEAVREHSADVLGVATHDSGALKRAVLGSVTSNLLRCSTAPLLIIGEEQELKKLHRVLVAVDLSNASAGILRHAFAIAQRATATLDVSYVAEPFAGYSRNAVFPDPETARLQLEALINRLEPPEKLAIHPRVAEGPSASVILEIARTEHHDLIVLGTSGRGGFSRVVLGSTANRVLTRSPLPLFVVPCG